MYKVIKQAHNPEQYVTINISKNVRPSFTKFRPISHKLLAERSCRKILKFDYELRKCTLHNGGDIEDK